MDIEHQTKPTPVCLKCQCPISNPHRVADSEHSSSDHADSGPRIEKRIVKQSVYGADVELPDANTEGSAPEINSSSKDNTIMSYEQFERYMALQHQTKHTPSGPSIEKSAVDVEVDSTNAIREGLVPEINLSSRDMFEFVMSYESYERYLAIQHQNKPNPSGPRINKRIMKESVVGAEAELPGANTEGSVPEINSSSKDITIMSYEQFERYMALQHQTKHTPSGPSIKKRNIKESAVDVEVDSTNANRDMFEFVMSYESYERYLAIQHQNKLNPSEISDAFGKSSRLGRSDGFEAPSFLKSEEETVEQSTREMKADEEATTKVTNWNIGETAKVNPEASPVTNSGKGK